MLKKKYSCVKVNQQNDGITWVIFNRPEKRNALDQETVLLFNEYTEKAKDKKYRAVVIGGNGNAFCAGADLEYLNQMKDFSYKKNF